MQSTKVSSLIALTAIAFPVAGSSRNANQPHNFNPVEPELFASLKTPESERFPSQKVDNYIRGWMERRNIPGATIGVVRGGKVEFQRAYGKSDVDQKVAVTEDTLFEIASHTKSFTAFAILCLEADGKLDLDDPIDKHIEMPRQLPRITIRNLLTHTSGLQDYIAQPELTEMIARTPSKEEVKTLILSKPLNFQPGTQWEYCNSGYYLAGLIIESCAKQNYYEYLSERIFKPLGMTHTKATDETEGLSLAKGLEWSEGRYIPSTVIPNNLWFSAGGLSSTVGDMLKWQQGIDTNKLLPEKYRSELWQTVKLNDGKSPDNVKLFNESDTLGYGLGWFVNSSTTAGSSKWAGTYGLSWGYSSYTLKNLSQDITIVVLTNREGINDTRPLFTPFVIAEGIARICAPDSIRPSDVKPSTSAPDLASLNILKTCLESLGTGKNSEELFTTEFGQKFNSRIPEYSQFLAAVGKPTDLVLLSEQEEKGEKVAQYKVQFKDTAWIFEFAHTLEGKVSKLAIVREVN